MDLRAVVLRAAAALPQADRQGALAVLRSQLTVMAHSAGGAPDWTSLTVTGPTEMPGVPDGARFEWTASVVVRGDSLLECLTDPDDEEAVAHRTP